MIDTLERFNELDRSSDCFISISVIDGDPYAIPILLYIKYIP